MYKNLWWSITFHSLNMSPSLYIETSLQRDTVGRRNKGNWNLTVTTSARLSRWTSAAAGMWMLCTLDKMGSWHFTLVFLLKTHCPIIHEKNIKFQKRNILQNMWTIFLHQGQDKVETSHKTWRSKCSVASWANLETEKER